MIYQAEVMKWQHSYDQQEPHHIERNLCCLLELHHFLFQPMQLLFHLNLVENHTVVEIYFQDATAEYKIVQEAELSFQWASVEQQGAVLAEELY